MIESKQNNKFKLWQKLKLKKHRDEHNAFLVYGDHLIEQAKKKRAIIELITTNPKIEGTLISKPLMNLLSQTETPFESMAICKKINQPIKSNKVLLLDNVQDPDNVGSLIRSAVAFGFRHIILGLQSADLYNEKTIRASQGLIFEVFVERRPLEEAILKLKKDGYSIVCADAHEKETSAEVKKIGLVLGNEGAGVQPKIKDLSDFFVRIETENVESLNVNAAGAILMYNWRDL
ncbi:MAG: RNA methyltransferase [Acholeplasmataceae bacterium]